MGENKKRSVSKLTKWLCYTVIIGLIPIGLRFAFSILIDGFAPISASEYIALGFVLHISILNELEHMTGDETWKSVSNVFSICAIVMYTSLMAILLAVEAGFDKIKFEQLIQLSTTLAGCSFFFCFVIFWRLTTKAKIEAPALNGEVPC
ncbi:hypothetical protein L4C37_05910 [Vibrio kagoshimensis]|uniref:hypothetical protein n=1 Tax=Vibrio kagoshimensis TaxID=2910244 RepID=UPI003D22F386